jgi:hypothetical protein
MAVSYVGIGTGSGTTSSSETTVAPSIPSGSNGDVLVAVCVHNGGTRTPSASGWTAFTNAKISYLIRTADGTEGSTVTITFASTYANGHAVVLRFAGADASTASDATEVETSAWSTSIDLPTVTAVSGGGLVWAAQPGNLTTSNVLSACSRANATERYDSTPNSYCFTLGVYTEENTSSGSTGTSTMTVSGTNWKYGNVLILPASTASVAKPVLFHSHYQNMGWR